MESKTLEPKRSTVGELLAILREIGEDALFEAFRTIFDEMVVTTFGTLGRKRDPIFSLEEDEKDAPFGEIWFFDVRLPIGTDSTFKEPLMDEEDFVPAARRLLGKIFKAVPNTRRRIRMLLEIKGFDVRRILSDD